MAMPNIFSLFNSQPAAPAAPAVDPNPASPNPGTIVPGTGGPAAIPPAGTGDKSPLSGFAKLWDTDPNNKAPTQPAPMFANDPQKLLDAARTIDFAKVIPAEIRAKVVAGGADAAEAFSAAINAVSQQAYAQSAHATTKIVEAALNKQREQILAEMPAMVRRHAVSETLRADNPAFTNPATAPMLSMLEKQLSTQHPTASAADLNVMAKQYLTEMAEMVMAGNAAANPAPASRNGIRAKTGVKDDDWGNFLEGS